MKLINLNSKKGIVNLFADFILKHINPQFNTIIQVTDLNYFILINGVTESNELLNLQEIKDKFISEYQTLLKNVGYGEILNIMDLIQYGKKIIDSDDRELWATYYDSSRPAFHQNIINEPMGNNISIDYQDKLIYEIDFSKTNLLSMSKFTEIQVSSEFPYGYSLSMGRCLFYYGEYIANQILDVVLTNKIDFYLTNKRNFENEPIFELQYQSMVSQSKTKSLILDNFSFNLSEFQKTLSTYDLCDDIKKPTEEKPWLVKDINPKDLIIF